VRDGAPVRVGTGVVVDARGALLAWHQGQTVRASSISR